MADYFVDSRMKLTGLTRSAVPQHLEVQVGAGRAAGFTHEGTVCPFLDLVTDGDEVFGIVRIAGRVAVAVIDLDHDAVAVALGGPGNHTVRNSVSSSAPASLPAKSMPVWLAGLPVNGSVRLPKYEEIQPEFTGRPCGYTRSLRFCFAKTLSSTFELRFAIDRVDCRDICIASTTSGTATLEPVGHRLFGTTERRRRNRNRIHHLRGRPSLVRRRPNASSRITRAFICAMRMAMRVHCVLVRLTNRRDVFALHRAQLVG